MLNIEQIDAKIEGLRKDLKWIGSGDTETLVEYKAHLERLLEAYQVERAKAVVRRVRHVDI